MSKAKECKAKIAAIKSEFNAEFERANKFAKQQKLNLKVFNYLVCLGVNADKAKEVTFCKSNGDLGDIYDKRLLGTDITEEDYFDVAALIVFS